MSEPELKRNPVLTDYTVRDLNKDPKLPYEDNTFDVITNVVSVDYLNRPLVRQHINFLESVLSSGLAPWCASTDRASCLCRSDVYACCIWPSPLLNLLSIGIYTL